MIDDNKKVKVTNRDNGSVTYIIPDLNNLHRTFQSGESKEITFDEFGKTELRVAKILTAERIEGANKLYKITVDLGYEQRTVVSGLVPYYKEDELIGKKVILVANLKPAKLRGIESRGMILAAGEGDNVKLVTVDGDMELGSIVC